MTSSIAEGNPELYKCFKVGIPSGFHQRCIWSADTLYPYSSVSHKRSNSKKLGLKERGTREGRHLIPAGRRAIIYLRRYSAGLKLPLVSLSFSIPFLSPLLCSTTPILLPIMPITATQILAFLEAEKLDKMHPALSPAPPQKSDEVALPSFDVFPSTESCSVASTASVEAVKTTANQLVIASLSTFSKYFHPKHGFYRVHHEIDSIDVLDDGLPNIAPEDVEWLIVDLRFVIADEEWEKLEEHLSPRVSRVFWVPVLYSDIMSIHRLFNANFLLRRAHPFRLQQQASSSLMCTRSR